MATQKRSGRKTSTIHTSVGNVGEKYNVDFKVPSNTRLSNYLASSGAPSLGKALTSLEQKVQASK